MATETKAVTAENHFKCIYVWGGCEWSPNEGTSVFHPITQEKGGAGRKEEGVIRQNMRPLSIAVAASEKQITASCFSIFISCHHRAKAISQMASL